MENLKDLKVKNSKGMKITVDANFRIIGLFDPPLILEFEKETRVKDVLKKLNEFLPNLKFLEGNFLGDDLRAIKINDSPLPVIPDSFDLPLKDGDKVYIELYMEPLGGG